MAIFTGAGVAIATPFDENYNIDYDSFGKLIDFQIENKTDAIIVCGTTGEAIFNTHNVVYILYQIRHRIRIDLTSGAARHII